MVVVSITLPKDLLKKFDDFVSNRGYFSRSEAFRDAVRSLISESELLDTQTERAFAAIMVVSEHPRKDVAIKLTQIRHEFDEIVTEACHRHTGDKYCLEILVAEGIVQRIRSLIGRIRGIHGIQQVKTVFMPI